MHGMGQERPQQTARPEIRVDLHRGIVFPNRLREQRRQRGYPKLLRLASQIPEIPYIRLSKIERGEVFARADEIRRIARALGLAPTELLIDIDTPGFDLERWAEPFYDSAGVDMAEERFAVLLAAAVRARRAGDAALTIAIIERDYGLPPVNLSRIENAQKPFARWNAATQGSIYALFGVDGEPALRSVVESAYAAGDLDAFLAVVTDIEGRQARTRARIAELAAELGEAPTAPLPVRVAAATADATIRTVPVHGAPLPQGLIADTPTGDMVEAPSIAGSRAFALRVGRATLGAGLPGTATVIVDPDRQPVPGGIAALREETGWRLLSVGADRTGRTIGYSVNPDLEVALDDCDPSALAAVVAALFV